MSLKIPASATIDALKTHQSLSPVEQRMLQGLTGDDLKRAKAQLMLQKQQETVSFVSNLFKGDTTLQVIGNLK
ncbi:hypothetical protein [Corallococcus terminator]|uniref:Uncharacterized protein n=1 Tax=Corallococcus terminator TaxID=2316733 RepID=A0A3A8JLC2_9BACT|nr:hypothetical protein [Corallococcus terminator]RKG92610.1 hypothetical protein D7V88_05460 [Corallococcus terminator]